MNKEILVASDFYSDMEMVTFIPLNFPYLVRYDLKANQIIYKKQIPKVSSSAGFFEHLIEYKDCIYAIPVWAEYVLCFNKKSSEYEKIEIDVMDTVDEVWSGYHAAVMYKDHIYAFKRFTEESGADTYNVLKIDCKNKSAVVTQMGGTGNFPLSNKFSVVFRRNCCICGDEILLIGQEDVFKYSIKENILRKVTDFPHVNGNVTCSLKMDAGQIFMLTSCNEIIIWSWKEEACIIYKIPEEIIAGNVCENAMFPENFGHCILHGESIYVFGAYADCIIEYDMTNGEIRRSWLSEILCGGVLEDQEHDYCYGQFSKPHIYGENLMVWNIWKKIFYSVDLKTREVRKTGVEMTLEV